MIERVLPKSAENVAPGVKGGMTQIRVPGFIHIVEPRIALGEIAFRVSAVLGLRPPGADGEDGSRAYADQRWNQLSRAGWRLVVWTSLTRAEADEARTSTREDLAPERALLRWAEDNGVLLINPDEGFAAPPMLHSALYESVAYQNFMNYGVQVDKAVVEKWEILRRFGGLAGRLSGMSHIVESLTSSDLPSEVRVNLAGASVAAAEADDAFATVLLDALVWEDKVRRAKRGDAAQIRALLDGPGDKLSFFIDVAAYVIDKLGAAPLDLLVVQKAREAFLGDAQHIAQARIAGAIQSLQDFAGQEAPGVNETWGALVHVAALQNAVRQAAENNQDEFAQEIADAEDLIDRIVATSPVLEALWHGAEYDFTGFFAADSRWRQVIGVALQWGRQVQEWLGSDPDSAAALKPVMWQLRQGDVSAASGRQWKARFGLWATEYYKVGGDPEAGRNIFENGVLRDGGGSSTWALWAWNISTKNRREENSLPTLLTYARLSVKRLDQLVAAPAEQSAMASLTKLAGRVGYLLLPPPLSSAQQRARNTWRPTWPQYREDLNAFKAAYQEGQESDKTPAYDSNITGGLSTSEDRGFGVEIEFEDLVLPDEQTQEEQSSEQEFLEKEFLLLLLDSIRHKLVNQQLSRRGREEGDAYSTAPDTWLVVKDTTLRFGGEVVSPISFDEVPFWQAYQTVLGVIDEFAGGATDHTGGHVHVGTGDFDIAAYNRLLKLTKRFEDVLFRLALNPEALDLRKFKSRKPHLIPSSAGYKSIADMAASDKDVAVSVYGANGGLKAHVEFRLWDGFSPSDPGTGQARIALSVALVQAALRLTEEEIDALPDEPLGSHHARFGPKAPALALAAESESFRLLLDVLFATEKPKKQLTALFARTQWLPVPQVEGDPETSTTAIQVTRTGAGEPVHLWVGIEPDHAFVEKLNSKLIGDLNAARAVAHEAPLVPEKVLVVHGHGIYGRLNVDQEARRLVSEAVGNLKAGPEGVSTVVLLACNQFAAQAFAADLTTWATDGTVFVSPYDGAVFYGKAEVYRDGTQRPGRLRHLEPADLKRYEPGGKGPVHNPGPPPLSALPVEQIENHPGPWWIRGGVYVPGPDETQPPSQSMPVRDDSEHSGDDSWMLDDASLTPPTKSRLVESDLAWIRDVNPYRDDVDVTDDPHVIWTNYVLSAIATDMTLAAKAAGDHDGLHQTGGADAMPAADLLRYSGRAPVPKTRAELAAVMGAAPVGARGIVTYRVAGGKHGHVVNVVNRAGKAVYLDGYAGRVDDLPEQATDVRFLPMFGLTAQQRQALDRKDLIAFEPSDGLAVNPIRERLRGFDVVVIKPDGESLDEARTGGPEVHLVDVARSNGHFLMTRRRPRPEVTGIVDRAEAALAEASAARGDGQSHEDEESAFERNVNVAYPLRIKNFTRPVLSQFSLTRPRQFPTEVSVGAPTAESSSIGQAAPTTQGASAPPTHLIEREVSAFFAYALPSVKDATTQTDVPQQGPRGPRPPRPRTAQIQVPGLLHIIDTFHIGISRDRGQDLIGSLDETLWVISDALGLRPPGEEGDNGSQADPDSIWSMLRDAGWHPVIWTTLAKSTVARAWASTTEEFASERTVLEWAEHNDVLLVNIDDAFATTQMPESGDELLRVRLEILHRFGGIVVEPKSIDFAKLASALTTPTLYGPPKVEFVPWTLDGALAAGAGDEFVAALLEMLAWQEQIRWASQDQARMLTLGQDLDDKLIFCIDADTQSELYRLEDATANLQVVVDARSAFLKDVQETASQRMATALALLEESDFALLRVALVHLAALQTAIGQAHEYDLEVAEAEVLLEWIVEASPAIEALLFSGHTNFVELLSWAGNDVWLREAIEDVREHGRRVQQQLAGVGSLLPATLRPVIRQLRRGEVLAPSRRPWENPFGRFVSKDYREQHGEIDSEAGPDALAQHVDTPAEWVREWAWKIWTTTHDNENSMSTLWERARLFIRKIDRFTGATGETSAAAFFNRLASGMGYTPKPLMSSAQQEALDRWQSTGQRYGNDFAEFKAAYEDGLRDGVPIYDSDITGGFSEARFGVEAEFEVLGMSGRGTDREGRNPQGTQG